jgi:hypothetical protein
MASLVNIKTGRQLSLGLHLRLNELKNKKQAQTTRVAWCHWCSHGRLKSNTLLPDPRHHLPCVLYGKHTQQPRRAGCCCPHRRGPFAGDSTTSNHGARRDVAWHRAVLPRRLHRDGATVHKARSMLGEPFLMHVRHSASSDGLRPSVVLVGREFCVEVSGDVEDGGQLTQPINPLKREEMWGFLTSDLLVTPSSGP